jgi:hypothetical protein
MQVKPFLVSATMTMTLSTFFLVFYLGKVHYLSLSLLPPLSPSSSTLLQLSLFLSPSLTPNSPSPVFIPPPFSLSLSLYCSYLSTTIPPSLPLFFLCIFFYLFERKINPFHLFSTSLFSYSLFLFSPSLRPLT